jgi:hypothetical protein
MYVENRMYVRTVHETKILWCMNNDNNTLNSYINHNNITNIKFHVCWHLVIAKVYYTDNIIKSFDVLVKQTSIRKRYYIIYYKSFNNVLNFYYSKRQSLKYSMCINTFIRINKARFTAWGSEETTWHEVTYC